MRIFRYCAWLLTLMAAVTFADVPAAYAGAGHNHGDHSYKSKKVKKFNKKIKRIKKKIRKIKQRNRVRCNAEVGPGPGADELVRDQFTARGLIDVASQMLAANATSRKACKLMVPDFSWTGEQPIPLREDFELIEINATELSGDELAERLLSLAALLMYELDPYGPLSALSTDIGGREPLAEGRGELVVEMQELMQDLADRVASDEIEMQETRELGLLLAITHYKSLAPFMGDDIFAFEANFTQLYSGPIHRSYNLLQSRDATGLAIVGVAQWWAWNFPSLVPAQFEGALPAFGITDENLAMIPLAFEFDAKALEILLQAQRDAADSYYSPLVYLDPAASQIFTFDGVDPDGYERPEELLLDPYLGPGTAGNFTWPEGYAVPFTELAVDGTSFPSIFHYEDPTITPTLGFKSLVEGFASSPEVAEQVLSDAEQIWNEKHLPKWEELRDIAVQRRNTATDDFYTGSWRGKIAHVAGVVRDEETQESVAIKVKDEEGRTVEIPMDKKLNRRASWEQALALTEPDTKFREVRKLRKEIKQLMEKTQTDIAEMDRWYEAALANAQGLHPGDAFNLVAKRDESKGICGEDYGTGTDPYESVQAIINNYTADAATVGVEGDLVDLVFQSGSKVSQFLYEVREFLANEYVKQNYMQYGFASEAEAGVCQTGSNGFVVYEDVRDDILEITISGFQLSDLGVLGRHYGYNADGTIKADEWDVVPAGPPAGDDPLKYVNPQDGRQLKYAYQQFDYIYRQHYAVDPLVALDSSNDRDPARGNSQLYQWGDAADADVNARYNNEEYVGLEVLNSTDIDTGKLGTYYRWKGDWVFQKLSGYVIANAVSQDLLPEDFVNDYFLSTFNDTNGDSCGFGLPDLQEGDIASRFRLGGQRGGSANSSSGPNSLLNIYRVFIRITTINPAAFPSLISQNQLFLHEGALGHGFDGLPDGVDFLRGIDSELSWVTNVNNNSGFLNPETFVALPHIATGVGTLFEGWATYGEILGVTKGLTVNFDEEGCPLPPGNLDLPAAFRGMVELSRVGGRQVVDVGMNHSRYAWTFYHSVREFNRLTDLPIGETADFYMRFIGHPTQQTTYAAGLVTNLGILSTLAAEAEARGCFVDEPEFNEFRITRTDYILGAPLTRIVLDNIDPFLKTAEGENCPIE